MIDVLDARPVDKWKAVKEVLQEAPGGKAFLYVMLFVALFPRIDAAVTTDAGHLLKGPFSLHPNTGRVCCVLDLNEPFRAVLCPTASSLAGSGRAAENGLATIARSAKVLEEALAPAPAADPPAEQEAPDHQQPKRRKKGVTDMRSPSESEVRPFPALTYRMDRVFVKVVAYVRARPSPTDEPGVVFVAHKAITCKPELAVKTLPANQMAPFDESPPLSIVRARVFSAVTAVMDGDPGDWSAMSLRKLVFASVSVEEAVRQLRARPAGAEKQIGRLGADAARDRFQVDTFVKSTLLENAGRTADMMLKGRYEHLLDW